MIEDVLPYAVVFLSTLVATLLLTPVARCLCRVFGMVDKPDPRRINVTPIPRGGGIAIVLGVFIPYALFHVITGRPWLQGIQDAQSVRMAWLGAGIALLGLVDDRFSLPPKVKLLGQLVIALLVWCWAGLGFGDLWPWLPKWLDCLITVGWVIGAVNAFNLIDGLDGLATGLAFIAVIGMAGALFFAQNPQATLFYFAFAGGLLGFLRYNWNPASVFLGDTGSMFLGFVVCTLPLASHAPNSFLVSVGVPLLAMGVPIFDTSLAIMRRSIRHLLAKNERTDGKSGQVMTADSDHLHHRIFRATGLNQRKTAVILYATAAAAVVTGLVAMSLESRAAGLWLAAVTVAAVVIFRDATIELFDAGRLLGEVAHSRDSATRRRFAVLSVPFYLAFDLVALVGVYFFCSWSLRLQIDLHAIRAYLPLRVVSTFAFLVFFRAYRTVWSRALGSNYLRLLLACLFGSVAGSVFVYYWPTTSVHQLTAMTVTYAFTSFTVLVVIRAFRGVVRDFFYALDCSRLKNRKDVSRILVYGGGLRYRSFRRELVRKASANSRIIVGILDDDVFLKGNYIGGIRILGTINDAPEVINRLNVDAVVVTCEVSESWLGVVKDLLRPTGVKLSVFSFSESSVDL